ncbi:MAG: ZIP family metal transporter [Candidatus Heimdallarchaeota archaeon]
MINEILAFEAILGINILSLVGICLLPRKTTTVDRLVLVLVAFGTGVILGAVLFEIIPEVLKEAVHKESSEILLQVLLIFIAVGFIAFYSLERFIYWFHGHHSCEEVELGCREVNRHESVKSFGNLSLLGDGIHNFMDGFIILVAFSLNIPTGIAVTLAVAAHELPQEIGDFGILLLSRMTREKALFANFLSVLTAVLGGVVALWFLRITDFEFYILAFAAGGFLYLAASELVPKMQKEQNNRMALIQLLFFTIGVFTMLGVDILLA